MNKKQEEHLLSQLRKYEKNILLRLGFTEKNIEMAEFNIELFKKRIDAFNWELTFDMKQLEEVNFLINNFEKANELLFFEVGKHMKAIYSDVVEKSYLKKLKNKTEKSMPNLRIKIDENERSIENFKKSLLSDKEKRDKLLSFLPVIKDAIKLKVPLDYEMEDDFIHQNLD